MVPVWSSPEPLKAACDSNCFSWLSVSELQLTVCHCCSLMDISSWQHWNESGSERVLTYPRVQLWWACGAEDFCVTSRFQVLFWSRQSCSGMFTFHSLVCLFVCGCFVVILSFHICLSFQFPSWEGDKEIGPRFQRSCLQRVANLYPEVILENAGQVTNW